MPLIPGLRSRIGENAHALALGKVALSLLDEHRLQRYIDNGLRVFTPFTIQEDELRGQLDDIRQGAVAFEREEFAMDFCCLALPVRDARGHSVAALGISMSARHFDLEREALSGVLRDVAGKAATVLRVPAHPEDANVLEHPVDHHKASASQRPRRGLPA
jgi:acetyl-CoA synthetase